MTSSACDRQRAALLRLAVALEAQLAAAQPPPPTPFPLPSEHWQACERLQRQSAAARTRGWHLAADRLERQWPAALARLRRELARCEEMRASEFSLPHATTGDLLADLVALIDEFADVNFDLRLGTLSVTTGRIVLEGHDLGPFEIELHWKQLLRRAHPYRIRALEPHPAASNQDVIHPHVSSERLCAGDGSAAVTAALQSGRLGDFFTIVRQILTTYGAGSPFIALDHWGGISCRDCGELIDPDQTWTCYPCGNSVCDDCRRTCSSCGEIHCSGCGADCAACGSETCRRCQRDCTNCGRGVCRDCLDATHTCHECQQEAEDVDDVDAENAHETEPTEPPSAPLHAVRLGETPLSPRPG